MGGPYAQLDAILGRLALASPASTNDETEALRRYVEGEARERTSESFTRFMNDLNKRIFDLVNSPSAGDKICGIQVIDNLIDVQYEENETKIIRFANYLRMVVSSSDPVILDMASKALGHLARAGGTLTPDFVEFEVKRALEWLQGDRYEHRRLAAVLVLKQLADNVPTLFNQHVAAFIDHIWVALHDPLLNIREAAIQALRSTLALISKRGSRWRVQWFSRVWNEAKKGLAVANPDTVHGSLMTIHELLCVQDDFMIARFKESCDIVLSYRDHRVPAVREAVLTTLPRLARYCPDAFVRGYMDTALDYITDMLQASGTSLTGALSSQRDVAFVALGEIAMSVGKRILPRVPVIVQLISAALGPKAVRRHQVSLCALTCLASVARSVGPELLPYITGPSCTPDTDLIELAFRIGLCSPLVDALTTLVECIPQLLAPIQSRLMSLLLSILTPETTSPSVPAGGRRASSANLYSVPSLTGDIRDLSIEPVSSPLSMDASAELVSLSLQTLGTFNLDSINLFGFLRDVLVTYLEHDLAYIRKQACITCARLLVRHTTIPPRGMTRQQTFTVSGVLERLLRVGIADPVADIRLTVFMNLHDSFDRFLAQAENLQSLFVALNDEVFPVRCASMSVIGRLALRNPAYVMPSLRKTLIQLLTELQLSNDSRCREESCTLLGHLIAAAQQLMAPYFAPVLNVLMPNLKDDSAGVSSRVLLTLGQLATVCGSDMNQYLATLMPLIMDTLQDRASMLKREAALRCIGQLIRSTGQVIEPYNTYRQLLPTLLDALKTEEASWPVRREALRVVGIVGALDPLKFKQFQNESLAATTSTAVDPGARDSSIDSGLGAGCGSPLEFTASSDDYYPTVAIDALMKIMGKPSLSQHHSMVIQAVMFIFKSLGMQGIPFLSQIIPPFLSAMRTSTDESLRETLFQQIGVLVSIVQQHIRSYLDSIFQIIYECWSEPPFLPPIITLIEEISLALKDEFKVYIPEILPRMLTLLQYNTAPSPSALSIMTVVIHAIETLAPNLNDYFFLVVPPLIRLAGDVDVQLQTRLQCVRALAALVSTPLNQLTCYASRIIHPLVRILSSDNTPAELRNAIVDLLCALLIQLGRDFTIFVPLIGKVITRQNLPASRYLSLVNAVLHPAGTGGSSLSFTESAGASVRGNGSRLSSSPSNQDASPMPLDALGPIKKLHISQTNLKKAWETSQRSTRDDWMEWFRRLAVELLKESPSPALRSCSALAQKYHPLAHQLFNVAFASCWTDLYDQYQDDLLRSLETAFTSQTAPPQLIQTLLNLAEFMEHDDNPLPISIGTLSELASKCHAFAKALHYKECEFRANATTTTSSIEALIAINNQLQQPEAAVGILEYGRSVCPQVNTDLREEWYEKLQRWTDALYAYERRQLSEPTNAEVALGRMRCLNALCEWERLWTLISKVWWPHIGDHDTRVRQRMAHLGAETAWHLGRWSEIGKFVEAMDASFFGSGALNQYAGADTATDQLASESLFYHALTAVHDGNFGRARALIDRDRAHHNSTIGALVSKGYLRAYREILRLQELAELEDIIEYRECDNAERRLVLQDMWTKRLYGCQADVHVWVNLLAIRALVIDPASEIDVRLKFASLCRNSSPPLLDLSLRTITSLDQTDYRVRFAMCKHLFAQGSFALARDQLSRFVSEVDADAVARRSLLASRSHRKLALWLSGDLTKLTPHDPSVDKLMSLYSRATQFDGQSCFKCWQSFALFNFALSGQGYSSSYVVSAVEGFFRALAYGDGRNALQNALRILDLVFRYGSQAEVNVALKRGLSISTIETWLEVIPQIIARIHTSTPAIRELIHALLCRIGRDHPQALVYPLTVAAKSASVDRSSGAKLVLDDMRKHSSVLVDQASLVSHELIRVAILWHELWHEGLEEASRLYFGTKNIPAMLAILEPLHAMMDKGPQTMREVSFQQMFGRDLQEAREWCKKYSISNNDADLNAAWELYCHVFRRIAKQMTVLSDLELPVVSPRLVNARNLVLAVPGTYQAGKPVVNIAQFDPVLKVIESKQRPRKLVILGSDGHNYAFLLKGHEDLRQDERVMQLFGLVNTLLRSERQTAPYDLDIKRYSTIPLAPNSGLIEWMPNCDTMHFLIKEYRESRKLLLNIEHRLMTQMSPDYAKLTLMQKIEVFEHTLANTTGMDLHNVLWLKSRTSEIWLERRMNYTRSLAVASMVGYVLGLGDRHPCNLMIDRVTGKIIHIDFGDCFEVAMTREKFPEKIPFRLTRMLINAMEVSGIEGNFRLTCQMVLGVLREHKDSVMAVLEAFVHDPLINWRLLKQDDAPSSTAPSGMLTGDRPDTSGGPRHYHSGVKPPDDDDFIPGSSFVTASQEVAAHRDSLVLNERALSVISRVHNKLTGRDFAGETLDIPSQVQRLVLQATSHENLCQCYIGWCPFW